MSESDSTSFVPFGYCHCGCGEKTKPARQTVKKLGKVKGRPQRFIYGHQRRSRLETHYKIEDRGYKTPCWIWQLGKMKSGYGTISRNASGNIPAHRWYYEQRFGSTPPGCVVHHLCEIKTCVNPEHMEVLEWGIHSSLHSRRREGKLSMAKAETIRRDHAANEASVSELAQRYGVTKGAIQHVLKGRSWVNYV